MGIARARVRSARAWRGVEGGGQAEEHLIILDVDKGSPMQDLVCLLTGMQQNRQRQAKAKRGAREWGSRARASGQQGLGGGGGGGGGQAEAHPIILDVVRFRIAGTSSVVVDLQRRSHNTVRDAFCAHAKRGGGAGSCAGSCAPPVVSIPHPSLKPPRPPPARRCRRAVSVGRAAQHRERAGGCVPGRARRRGESHPFRPDPLPPGVSC